MVERQLRRRGIADEAVLRAMTEVPRERFVPAEVRRQYGFSWDPVRSVALHGGAEYVKRVVVPVLPERMRMLPLARAA